jgi:hypothetical protein
MSRDTLVDPLPHVLFGNNVVTPPPPLDCYGLFEWTLRVNLLMCSPSFLSSGCYNFPQYCEAKSKEDKDNSKTVADSVK